MSREEMEYERWLEVSGQREGREGRSEKGRMGTGWKWDETSQANECNCVLPVEWRALPPAFRRMRQRYNNSRLQDGQSISPGSQVQAREWSVEDGDSPWISGSHREPGKRGPARRRGPMGAVLQVRFTGDWSHGRSLKTEIEMGVSPCCFGIGLGRGVLLFPFPFLYSIFPRGNANAGTVSASTGHPCASFLLCGCCQPMQPAIGRQPYLPHPV